jgi:hypothetical protein
VSRSCGRLVSQRPARQASHNVTPFFSHRSRKRTLRGTCPARRRGTAGTAGRTRTHTVSRAPPQAPRRPVHTHATYPNGMYPYTYCGGSNTTQGLSSCLVARASNVLDFPERLGDRRLHRQTAGEPSASAAYRLRRERRSTGRPARGELDRHQPGPGPLTADGARAERLLEIAPARPALPSAAAACGDRARAAGSAGSERLTLRFPDVAGQPRPPWVAMWPLLCGSLTFLARTYPKCKDLLKNSRRSLPQRSQPTKD